MDLLNHLFYFTTFLFIYKDVLFVFAPKIRTNILKKEFEINVWSKGVPEITNDNYNLAIKNLYLIPLSFWFVGGFFTNDRLLFLMLLCIMVLNFNLIGKKFDKRYMIAKYISCIIKIIWGLFLVVNHYYFQIKFY